MNLPRRQLRKRARTIALLSAVVTVFNAVVYIAGTEPVPRQLTLSAFLLGLGFTIEFMWEWLADDPDGPWP